MWSDGGIIIEKVTDITFDTSHKYSDIKENKIISYVLAHKWVRERESRKCVSKEKHSITYKTYGTSPTTTLYSNLWRWMLSQLERDEIRLYAHSYSLWEYKNEKKI